MQERSLMFAIASDDTKSVHHALEHGHADPNEPMGPQSALAFALTNERLAHKLDIVKALLAYGADPMALRNPTLNPPHRNSSVGDDPMLLSPPPTTTLEVMDPAMRYVPVRALAITYCSYVYGEDTISQGLRLRKRVAYRSSSNGRSSAPWAGFVMTLLDKIKSLSSCSPCSINVLGRIQRPLLSYYYVVSVSVSVLDGTSQIAKLPRQGLADMERAF
jgi:hypothetical protein